MLRLKSVNNLDKKEQAKADKPKIRISPARLAAFEILWKIEKEKAFSSALLPIYESQLNPIDRGLCHELTLGVLRKQLYLDKIIAQFSNNKKLDLEIKIALRLGLYQLLLLDKIPAYSAINESVNLVVKSKKHSAKGFVNAILRRATREEIKLEFADEMDKISVETSHPRWLLEKWIGQFGFEAAQKLAESNNETPKLSYRFTAKTTESVKASLQRESIDNEQSFLRELADNGKIYFQDEASQLVAKAVNLQVGEKFLDVCAAPASKLTQIATDCTQTVYGGDLHFRRLELMKNSAQKQGLNNIQILQYNAEDSLPFGDETFDVVLVDAPCSGTGTIRHNPEIRYNLCEQDLPDLSAKQLKILQNASKLLKHGGRLIYSTCSLEPEENESVVENFMTQSEGFSVIENNLPAIFQTGRRFARTFPQRDKMDGFFIAVMKKS